MPLTQDPYDGFHIGVPTGWNLFTLNGTIVVSKDPTDTEQAVVYPVLTTAGLTTAAFFSEALDSLEKQVAASGGTMTHVVTSTGNQSPAATLRLSAGQVALVGEARVEVLPEATAYGSSQLALLAMWAKSEQFATDRETLAAIGACYAPQPGALYQVMRDQVFTYPIPPGWSVASESQDGITIADGADVAAGFLLAMPPPGSGVTSPQTLLSWVLDQQGLHVDQIVRSTPFPDQQTSAGATQSLEDIEFTGTRQDGQAIHGRARVTSVVGTTSVSGVIRFGLATTNVWNSVNGALVHIYNSIQHSSAQDLQQWEQLNRQQQSFAQQVQGFDYALTGVDLVHDPSTGATYEAPYDTWNPSGPDGPGYYNRVNQKLQIQTP